MSEKEKIAPIVSAINQHLDGAYSAFEMVELIRSLPNPILVDMAGVLVGQMYQEQVNPEAHYLLEELEKVGTVFIVTASSNREGIKSHLKENGLLSDNIVLFTAPAWEFIRGLGKRDKKNRNLLVDDFADTTSYQEDIEELRMEFEREISYKRIAPIFNQDAEIPLIDDWHRAVTNNPGILGIHVPVWDPPGRPTPYEPHQNDNSLQEAVAIIKEHYSK